MGHYDKQREESQRKFAETYLGEGLSKRINITDPCRKIIVEMMCEVLVDTMQVFDFGAAKHPDSGDTPNFLTAEGNKCAIKERGSSILRHAAQSFGNPAATDDESNLPHLLHLMASCAILYIRHKRNIQHPLDVKMNTHNEMENGTK